MFKIQSARAHCDIPCKIYDPLIIQVAAQSVARLTDLLIDLDTVDSSLNNRGQFVRLVTEKETQASKVKDETRIIWGDYFKDPQLEAFPQTHDIVHNIMLTASKCKQEISKENATSLVEKVNEFSAIFWQTKGIKTRTVIAPYPPSLPMVVPMLKDA